MALKFLAWLGLTIQFASADWQFLSRPDLAPPILNITVPATTQAESGYIFVAPKGQPGADATGSGPEQPGPHIFRDDGELVWSGVGYYGGYVIDFGAIMLDGKPALRAFQGSLDPQHVRMNGNHAVLDNMYQTISVVRAASHRLVSGHEFNVIDGRTALVEILVPVPTNLSIYGGDYGQQWVISAGFQEIDIQTGQLIFEWYSLDHVSPEYSAIPLQSEGPYNARSAVSGWHYFMINSVDKDSEGNYLISARHYSAIYKLNGTTGEIIWQLGGRHGSDFHIPSNLEFAFQHDARIRYQSPDGSIERISFLDNANGSPDPSHDTGLVSKARYIELNHTAKTVSEIWTYPAPDGMIANSQGNVQFLPNGNTFVNWGQTGVITEHSENGTLLYQTHVDSYPSHNRRTRSASFEKEKGGLLVCVSWNGDTETKAWQFHLRENQSGQNVNILGVQARTGFETKFEANVTWSLEVLRQYSVVAEALNSTGHSIGLSRPIRVQDDAPFRAHIDRIQVQAARRISVSQERMEL
ncbi:hypothetical protein N7507_007991 [Penicillium longicatenatum]|nr:hypothetical protein N7507_007991 [Penicillium longicatenatum]